MSYTGSGVFVINSTGQPVVSGTTISNSVFNALTSDLATGLTTALCKDGQSTPTANLPLGGFKLTGLGDATTAGDALRYNGAAGTPTAIVLTNATGLPMTTGVTGTLPVANGGTGKTTLTAHGVLIGNATGGANATSAGTTGQVLTSNGASADPTFQTAAAGSVTSVAQSFTGGLISVGGSPITSTGTLALTVAGTSGGIPYFDSATSWVTSAALAANSLVKGGGAGAAPSTITTGANVLTALGVAVGSAGAFVTFNGALGTPSSGDLSSCTGYPLTVPQQSQSTNYTAVLGDANKHLFHPSSDANNRTFTIPANASVAYVVGTTLSFVNMSANNLTIAITTDTLYLAGPGTTGSRTLAQYGLATAIKMTSTTWLISGSGIT